MLICAANDLAAAFCGECGAGFAVPNQAPPVAVAQTYRAPPMQPMAQSAPGSVMHPEDRRRLLSQRISQLVAEGYRVESQNEYMAVLVSGRRVNHLLHFFIGVFTLGLWWIVWILIAAAGGERRQVLAVDEFGAFTMRRANG